MARFKKEDFINADDFIAQLPPARREKIEARARELIAEEMTMRELRKACEMTQSQIGTVLGIGQEHVSRIEQRADILLSTLASYVTAMGGNLKLIVEFPGRRPVELKDFSDLFSRGSAPARSRRKRKEGKKEAGAAAQM